MFVSGDAEEDVVISIVEDVIPELDEIFCVSLILPRGGAEIGDFPEGIYIVYHTHTVCSGTSIAVHMYDIYVTVILLYSVCDYFTE